MPLADTLNRKPGDILKSDDWNVIIKEIDRKINRDGADTLKGPLTIAEALKVNSSVTISGNLSVTNVLEIGDPPFAGNTAGNRDWMQKGIKINWDSDSLFIGLKNEGTNRKDAVIAWGNDPQDDLRFVNVLSGGDVQGKELMRIKPSGNVGIGTNPVASLDIASASRTGTHPTAVKGLYITGDFNADNDGVEFRHSNGTQGIGFGFNTIYAAGSNPNQDLQLKPKGTGEVKVAGNLSVTGLVSFGSQVRQMLNLWSTNYGIGVQGWTQYFRSDANFAWYKGGSHNGAELNPGGGTSLMTLDANGKLSVSGNLSVTNVLEIGDPPFGNREWMQKGIKINWDSDSLFIGLKNEGTNRKDAVIAWGDDPQDDLRFVNVLAGGEVQGKELMRIKPSGNVGIGISTPNDKLDVAGSLRILTGSNPIRFTSSWSCFPDAVTNQAEISNDTGAYQTLMIVGNKSANLGRRVSIWDRLEVNGALTYWSMAQVSSRKLKKNILDISAEEAVQSLAQLNPVKYNLKADKDNNLHLGFIAEDVPDLVASRDRKTISPNHIVAVLTKVLKEQQNTILELAEKVKALESQTQKF
ncbi:MAG: tail fiber domain-containing protein [Microcystis wesenbergii Mw_QC_S_20081001_S30D]|uniref:Tail fiber domain-containing protein n=1 Tax=Microcystis wesenbergii Mw_QC_S_20081001_S30D TaxID=2486245 RepID=A0A552JSP2_9CHRO|nr:MAG: tail fiber domain-containing protein [Microcystis wesenbergii Mw_QC_S_20081001_S30]TRU98776.1 MAG: tail fiber domain-containing protein [Microcystis wesenbergii Mw_QC_S_20081001_S30D]